MIVYRPKPDGGGPEIEDLPAEVRRPVMMFMPDNGRGDAHPDCVWSYVAGAGWRPGG